MIMDVRIWELDKVVNNKNEDMELAGSFPIVMYKDIEYGGFVEIGGIVYRMCMYSSGRDILAVEKVELFEEYPKAIDSSDYTCPYCKSVNYDAWELYEDEGMHYCGSCSSDVKYKRVRTKTNGSHFSYRVESIKMAPYTKLS